MRRFTRAELARYDGRQDARIYFAFDGKVYDATHSFHWQTGRHQVRHRAGLDYAGNLQDAPHGVDMLERLPVVGWLADESEPAG